MIRIASIVWYKVLPPRFGGQKGIALFNQHLATHHPLVCICSKNNEATGKLGHKLLPVLPLSKSQFLNPYWWNRILGILKREKTTHLILEHPYHGIAGWLARKRAGVKLIVHSHNIESNRFREQGKWWWRFLSVYEGWTHRHADLSLFKTATDLFFAVRKFKLPKEKCMVVPYGTEKEDFTGLQAPAELIRKRHGISENEKILLFAGTLDYKPNADAVESLFKKIIPLLSNYPGFEFRILVCGRNRRQEFAYLRNFFHPKLIMVGEVDDIENYFLAADLFADPVTMSGGIQTKLVEALGYNLNIVCFEDQLQGIPMELASGKIFLAPKGDWEAFADRLVSAAAFSPETPQPYFDYFSWKRIAATVADKISQLK